MKDKRDINYVDINFMKTCDNTYMKIRTDFLEN